MAATKACGSSFKKDTKDFYRQNGDDADIVKRKAVNR
jgi:hypothetical protein